MPSRRLPRGLYAITDQRLCARGITSMVQAALEGGAPLIQYRNKTQDHARRRTEASALARLCQEYGALLIVNDDIELAARCGAHGVHLGQDDGAIGSARDRLGPQAIIGVSCYNELGRALAAQAAGANYVAFGRFFPSSSKPEAIQADPDLLRQARSALDLPLVAIGGITPENGGLLIEAGADLLAVIQALFGEPDIGAACRAFRSLFQPEPEETRP